MFQRILGRASALLVVGMFLHISSALPQQRLSAQAAPSHGIATFSASGLSFGAVPVLSPSSAQSISLSNTGTGPLGSIVLSVTNPDYTIASNTCPATLPANSAPCTITVIFLPSFVAPDPGGLVVTDDGAIGTTIAFLSGTGFDLASILPFEIFFDGQAVGTPSAQQQATFSNQSDSVATITSVTSVGNAAGDFALSSGCGATVQDGGTCTVGVKFTPTVAGPRTADLTVATSIQAAPFVSHLTGNGAIRHLQGFTTNILPPNDDESSANEVPLPFSINFFGTTFSSLWVNNNGNVTFGEPLSEFTPSGLNSNNGGIPIIAAYWADVDTTGALEGAQEDPGSPPSAVVTYGVDTVNGHPAFGVTYENVGYFGTHTDKLNSFQLILIDRSDTGITGAFDMEFDYDKIQWESGDASGGADGLCGTLLECTSAAVGYSNGTGDAGTNFQLPGSFVPGALLDNGPVATSLIHQALNGTVIGRTTFQVRNGTVQSADLSLAMTQSANPVPAGSNETYTLTIANAGPNDATNVTVTDTLPTNATLVSATPSQGAACTGTTILTCNLGTVANTANATLTIVVAVNATATGTLANSASVVSDLPDPNMQNNTASLSATIGPATNFALTVTRAGTGTGTVTSTPAGINCPTACTASFASGTAVTLTQVATAGSTFAGWSGACTGTGSCVVTLTAAASVTATFSTSTTFALTVTRAGTGTGTVTSTPAGINCPTACTANFASGTAVTLTQVATAGSTFAGWSGACTGTGACAVTLAAATSVTATFNTSSTFALTVTRTGTGTGTVTSAPTGINCPTACSANFASGTQVVLTATPATGSTFTGWTDATCEGTGTCTITITAATSVTASFGGGTNNFTLSVSEAGNGTGGVTSNPAGINCPTTCSASFTSGAQVTLVESASEGSTFAGWSGACTGTGACVVTMTAAESVVATFNSSNNPVIITVPSGGSTTATTSPGGTAFYGLLITGAPGVTGMVQLTCASSSPLITCTVIPSTVTLNGGTTEVAFGIQTFCQAGTPVAGSVPAGFGGGISMLLAAMLLGGIGWTFKRDRRVAVAFAMVMMITIGLGACASLPKGPSGVTPAGTYTISLSSTLNGHTQTLPNFLTLVVK